MIRATPRCSRRRRRQWLVSIDLACQRLSARPVCTRPPALSSHACLHYEPYSTSHRLEHHRIQVATRVPTFPAAIWLIRLSPRRLFPYASSYSAKRLGYDKRTSGDSVLLYPVSIVRFFSLFVSLFGDCSLSLISLRHYCTDKLQQPLSLLSSVY